MGRKKAPATLGNELQIEEPHPHPHPHPEEPAPESATRPLFLRVMDDPNYIWTFKQSGNRKITARVIHYLVTVGSSIPITLQLETEDGDIFEIPWVSIQTIHLVGKKKTDG